MKIEKSLSKNTVDAYLRDIRKLNDFFNNEESNLKINDIEYEDFQNYLSFLNTSKKGLFEVSCISPKCLQSIFPGPNLVTA